MNRIRYFSSLILIVLLIAGGAMIPYAAAVFGDREILDKTGTSEINNINISIVELDSVGKMALLSEPGPGDAVTITEASTIMTETVATETLMKSLEPYIKSGLIRSFDLADCDIKAVPKICYAKSDYNDNEYSNIFWSVTVISKKYDENDAREAERAGDDINMQADDIVYYWHLEVMLDDSTGNILRISYNRVYSYLYPTSALLNTFVNIYSKTAGVDMSLAYQTEGQTIDKGNGAFVSYVWYDTLYGEVNGYFSVSNYGFTVSFTVY